MAKDEKNTEKISEADSYLRFTKGPRKFFGMHEDVDFSSVKDLYETVDVLSGLPDDELEAERDKIAAAEQEEDRLKEVKDEIEKM